MTMEGCGAVCATAREVAARLAQSPGGGVLRRWRASCAAALATAFVAGAGVVLASPAIAGGAGADGTPAFAPAAQADARGRALYEERCGGCHDRSVHQRSARSATDFAGVRAAVVRWDREIGALWRGDEIDAVTRYLNERYYQYPCSGPACPAPRADGRG